MSQKPFLLFFKSHVDTFTRKDGTVVQAHDTKVQAKANLADVAKTHSRKFESKAVAWGNHGSKVPASDIPADAPSFTHKEVYGHDGKTSPVGTDFSDEFKKKAPQHFVINHKNGDRHLVNTEGYGYARYHATIDADKKEEPAAPEESTPAFKKPKSHEKLHKEAEAGVAHSPAHAAEHKRLMGLYGGASADWERQAVNRSINKNHQRALKEAPAKTAPAEVAPVKVATKNEGYGYHGAAMDAHRAEKFGVDGDLKTEADHVEQRKVADQAFSRVADKLVKDGHFSSHEEAGNYLDSRDGRHVGDEIGHKGDPSSVSWLARSVARHKKELAKK